MCCLVLSGHIPPGDPSHTHLLDNELAELESLKRLALADNLYKAEMLTPPNLPIKPIDPMTRRFRELIWESKK